MGTTAGIRCPSSPVLGLGINGISFLVIIVEDAFVSIGKMKSNANANKNNLIFFILFLFVFLTISLFSIRAYFPD
jgi:hypothetical protein